MISFISYIDFNDKIFFKFLFTFFYIEISFVTLHGYSDSSARYKVYTET